MSASYGQKTLTPGSVTQYTISANSGWAIVQNESPYNLNCTIDGSGSTRSIPAQCMDKITIPAHSGFNGNIVLMPINLLANSASAPSFAVLLDAYGINEEPTGTYPVALMRAVQVGGSVSTVTTQANTLLNTGNAPLTQVITISPSDAGGANTWSADNSGNLQIKSDNGGVLSNLIQLIAGASPKVLLAATAILTEVVGSLTVDQFFTATGTATMNGNFVANSGATISNGFFTCNSNCAFNGTFNIAGGVLNLNGNDIVDASGLNTSFFATTGNNMQFKVGSTLRMTIDGSNVTVNAGFLASAGATVNGNSLFLTQGSIKRLTHGSFTSNSTTSQSVAHGMATDTPDEIIVWCAGSTSTATGSVVSIGAANFVFSCPSSISWHFEARKY